MLVPDPRVNTGSLSRYLSLCHVPGTTLCTGLGGKEDRQSLCSLEAQILRYGVGGDKS